MPIAYKSKRAMQPTIDKIDEILAGGDASGRIINKIIGRAVELAVMDSERGRTVDVDSIVNRAVDTVCEEEFDN